MREGSPPPGQEERRADLHIHTWYSDGSLSPPEVVKRARTAGLQLIAITDHDTLAGIGEAVEAGWEWGVEVMPGVELAAQFGRVEVHILGLGITPSSPALRRLIELLQEEREERAARMVERLRALGLSLNLEEVRKEAGKGGLGRPHVAQALVRKGLAESAEEAFALFLASDRPAYIPRKHLTPAKAIAAIHEAGGWAVLAHPLIGGPQREHVRELISSGLDGLEVVHPKLTPEQSTWLRQLANIHGLAVTGGSDYHGQDLSPGEIGEFTVPCEYGERLLSAPPRLDTLR